jgi:membrane protein DedA with SNARE-associated domain
MEEFLARWGVVAVLAGAALEGDGSMVMSGVLVHVGLLDLPAVLIAGALGAFVSDCVCFAIGRSGAAAIRGSRAYARVAPLVERLARRVGLWEVVAARFVYGTRVASMIFWGTRPVAFARFAVVDAVGCVLWAVAFSAVGWALGGSAELLLGDLRRAEHWLVRLLAAVAVVATTVHLAVRRWRRRA